MIKTPGKTPDGRSMFTPTPEPTPTPGRVNDNVDQTQAFETQDYKTPAGYKENKEKDTKAADVEAITYEPKLSTFEMDIMEAQGIKEDRIPHKTYWY